MEVGEKRAKMDNGEEADRIGVLPLHLREFILECVPLKDAMRTSVLARKWRYCWTGIRKLDFNCMDHENVKVFRRAVDRVLMLHSGPIRRFDLLVPSCRNRRSFNVCDWFHVLSKNGIQDLEFDAFSYITQNFPLPSSLFACRDLKKLVLYYCKFSPPPNFMGFYNLIDLEINFCKVPSHILGSLISQCPLLEKLSLDCTCTKYREQPLVINALNLKTVYVEDDVWGTIIFKCVPRLAYVSLLISDIDGMELKMPCSSWDFLCSISLIEELVFDIFLLGPVIGNCPRCLPAMFQNLKTLSLRSVNACVEDDICFVLCLIRSSPGLQNLTIYLESNKSSFLPEPEKSREAAQKLLETEEKEQCKLSNLVTAVLHGAEGSSYEIMLVKILLSRCPNLKSLKVTPDVKKRSEEDFRMHLSREFEKIVMPGNSRGRDESDRITKLPDEIIGHILGYLPICDSVRTCVLARRWRYSWTKTVQLNLYYVYDGYIGKKMTKERFFKLVLRVLASHVCPVHKCVLRPNSDDHVFDVEGDVNIWLRFLSTMDVKDLTIDCHSDLYGFFELPPYAFQCLGLSCLTLQDCKLEYPIEFKGFPNLTRLDLSYVELHEDMINKVISTCPLEMLFIKHCGFYGSRTDFRPCTNAISASSLRVLNFVGADIFYHRYLKKYTSNLKVASLLFERRYYGDDDDDDDWIESGFDILIYMPKIEVLTYSCRLRVTHPKEPPELLGNLKTVSLRDIDMAAFSANEKSFVFCIMRRCPNLENLEIHITNSYTSRTEVDKDSMRAVIAYLEVQAEEVIRTSITTLTVSFEGFDEWEHIEAEIALTESIVSCCPALGKLVVKGSSSLNGHAKLQLSRALRRFGRSSSNSKPKIIYSNAR
ncbi:unnamed protein product [Rhodiola kirilowii]